MALANEEKKNKKPIPALVLTLMEKLKLSGLSSEEYWLMAQELFKNESYESALKVYEEIEKMNSISSGDKWMSTYQKALCYAGLKKYPEALETLSSIAEPVEKLQLPEKVRESYQQTVLSLIQDQQQQQQNKEQEKKEDEKKDQEKKDQENKDQQQKDQGEGKEKEQDKEQEKQQEKDKQEEKKEEKEKEGKNQQEQGKPTPTSTGASQDAKPQSAAQKQQELSPLLKKLLNEDRNLQQKLMNTTTKEKSGEERKDW
jgi:Ca-activated chloride channel family protein